MKLLIATPGRVTDRRHVAMIRVQTLLVPRLRVLLPDLEIVSALTVDWCADELRQAIDKLGQAFDLYRYGVPPEHGQADWGIRRQTHYAMALADEIGATHLMRVGQDTFVDQLQPGIADWIPTALDVQGDWIAAHVHHWPGLHGHEEYLTEAGLTYDADLRYANGGLIMAPLETWHQHYLPMPTRIVHSWDDVIFSESVRHRGGNLIDWPDHWRHVHDSIEVVAREAFAKHQEQLAAAST